MIFRAVFLFLLLVPCVSSGAPSWTVSEEVETGGGSLQKYCLEKIGDNWSKSESCDVRKENIEVLFFDVTNKKVFLGANLPPKRDQVSIRGQAAPSWVCFYGAFGTASRTKHGYTVCSSLFTKGSTGNGEAVIGNMVNILFATTRVRVVVDREALMAAAEKSGLIAEVESRQRLTWLNVYREAFQTAKSSVGYEKFIATYRDDDPESLVPAAEERRQVALKLEEGEAQNKKVQQYRDAFRTAQSSSDLDLFILQYRQDDPDGLVPKAKTMRDAAVKREVAERKLQDAEERKRLGEEQDALRSRRVAFRNEVSGFRQGLKVGDDAHCGLIVEVRKPLAKIQTMVGERWLKIEQVYPKGMADCRFFNGEYQSPSGLPL